MKAEQKFDAPVHPLDAARANAADIVYMPHTHLDAIALMAAASSAMDVLRTVPRGLITAPEKESGKTTALDVISGLSYNTWWADSTQYALRAKFNEPEPPFLIIDEISTIFGTSGLNGANNQLGRILREGYRRSAQISMAVNRMAEDVPAFCFAAFAGLKNAVPQDVRSRCIVWNMRPIPEGTTLPLNSTDPDTEALLAATAAALHQWVRSKVDDGTIKDILRSYSPPHPKFRSRRAQIWEPLYAIAKAVSPEWEVRAIDAFKAMALDASEKPVLLPEQMMLQDAAAAFQDSRRTWLFASDILAYLRALPDAQLWQDLSNRRMELLMTRALGPATPRTVGSRRARGYEARPIINAWRRLDAHLSPAPTRDPALDESIFDELPLPPEDTGTVVTEVTEVLRASTAEGAA